MQDPNAKGAMTAASSAGSLPGPSTAQAKVERERKVELSKRVLTILRDFWTEDSPDEVRSMELEGWLDALGDASPDELRMAWADYQRTGNRASTNGGKFGKLIKPDAGALYHIIQRERRLKRAGIEREAAALRPRLPPAPPPPPLSLERRRAIMAEVWGDRITPEGNIDLTVTPKAFPEVPRGE